MKYSMYGGFTELAMREGVEKAAGKALELEFNGVEFLADKMWSDKEPFTDAKEAAHAKKLLDEAGLDVSCYSVAVNLWNNPGVEEVMHRQIEIAAALGSPFVHHTLLPWLELSEETPNIKEGILRAAEIATRIAKDAEAYHITCIYEDQGHYVNGVENFGTFWKIMKENCTNVGICGDLGNILFVNETPEDFLKVFVKDVCHVHVKDYLKKQDTQTPGKYWEKAEGDIWLRDTMVGSGVIDFKVCLDLLKQAGYQGYYSLELSHPEPYEEGVRQAMEYLNRRERQ